MNNLISSNGNPYKLNSLTTTYHQPIIKWKGKTFSQIIASIQRNKHTVLYKSPSELQKALPKQIYRKEIATSSISNSNSQKIAIKIDSINQPNGYFITQQTNPQGVLTATIDLNYENNTTQHPNTCSSFLDKKACLTVDTNAKKRVRSAGMYHKNYNILRNNASNYYSSSKEYLHSRSLTFNQNQFNYLRNGDAQYKPNSRFITYNNDYSAQGIQHCIFLGDHSNTNIANIPHKPVFYKPKNYNFAQQGGVCSSLQIERKKINAMENAALLTSVDFGIQTANSMKYSVNSTTNTNIYNLKVKTGYPMKCTPIITK
jgi:hypothetical protein